MTTFLSHSIQVPMWTFLSLAFLFLGMYCAAYYLGHMNLVLIREADEWRDVAREYRNSTASVKHGVHCHVVARLIGGGFKASDERCALCRQYDAANEGTK